MTTLLAFLAAFAGGVIAFEFASLILRPRFSSSLVVRVGEEEDEQPAQISTWVAVLGTIFPRFFNLDQERREKVVDLIRRAGYFPYGSLQEFYLGAMTEFGKGIIQAALAAVAFYWVGLRFFTPFAAIILLWLAYRRPYSRLREAAQRRAELMRPNMLAGLAELESLILAGVGVQEALRRTAQLGGPFCNLLALLVARLEVEEPARALERVRQHVPDPTDTNMMLFLRDLEDYFIRQRPLAPGLSALRRAVHQDIVNATVARASKVKQSAGLFGVLAVIGMVIAVLAPVFAGGGL